MQSSAKSDPNMILMLAIKINLYVQEIIKNGFGLSKTIYFTGSD